MDSDCINSIFIKQEMDDCASTSANDISQFIKVEIDEEAELENELHMDHQGHEEIDIFLKDTSPKDMVRSGLTESELNHVEWLEMKAKNLDSMKGKYISQLEEYLKLATLRKKTQPIISTSKFVPQTERKEFSTEKDSEDEEKLQRILLKPPGEFEREKSIIPSRKKQKGKNERIKIIQQEIDKRMRDLESESMNTHYQEKSVLKSRPEVSKKNVGVHDKVSTEKKKRLQRKVELERERRKGLTQLFDELDYWVELERKNDPAYQEAKLTRFNKPPYYERNNAAIKCIKDLECSLKENEQILKDLQVQNDELRKIIRLLNESESEPFESSVKSPYNCEDCKISFPSIEDAFTHESNMQFRHKKTSNVSSSKKVESTNSNSQLSVYKCKDCPTVCLDRMVLQVHKLLHQELTYFYCSQCEFVFGLPSKLKKHFFLEHGGILNNDLEQVLDTESRVEVTYKVQKVIANSDPNKVELVDNFLEASLDAKLIQDEISLNWEVNNIPEEDLGKLLDQYIKYDIKVEPVDNSELKDETIYIKAEIE